MITTLDIERTLNAAYTDRLELAPPRFPISASSAGHCGRQLSALLKGIRRQPFTAKSARVFEDGHDRDKALGAAFERGYTGPGTVVLQHECWTTIGTTGLAHEIAVAATEWLQAQLSTEEPPIRSIEDKLQMRGRPDIVIVRDKSVDIIDVKGRNAFGLKQLPTEGPDIAYKVQLGNASLAFKEIGYRVDSLHLLYENKDTQEWLPYELDIGECELEAKNANAHNLSLLMAFAKAGFTGLEGTPRYTRLAANEDKAELPWQCNYCPIGPQAGQCTARSLVDKRKAGAAVPKWTFA